MAKKTQRTVSQDRMLSETFLDFAGPLLEEAGERPIKELVEAALKLAFMVWNSVVLETVNGGVEFTTTLRQCIAYDPYASAQIEKMISRKKALFGNDLRLVSDYEILEKDGEWRLRAEARAPAIRGSIC